MLPKKGQNRLRRKVRVRSKVTGTAARPRMSVFRSLTQMTVQLIDDEAGKTIASASTKEAKAGKNTEAASKLGTLIAEKAKKAKIDTVVFDRNGYAYHGRVKALAESAREAGLTF